MSSLFGHAAVGGAAYLAWSTTPKAAPRHWPLWVLMAIAVAPDFDHLAIWYGNMDPAFRPTHSISVCALLGVLAWMAGRQWARDQPSALPLKACLLASLSHLLLDSSTGVHHDPLLWPLSGTVYHIPWGLLPAAGRMNPASYYFWRNLTLELGVLMPILTGWVLWQQGRLRERWNQYPWAAGAMAAICATCLLISTQLQR